MATYTFNVDNLSQLNAAINLMGPGAYASYGPLEVVADGSDGTDITVSNLLSLSPSSFFAPECVGLVTMPGGSDLPVPVTGDFNIEVVTTPVGTNYPIL